MAQNFLTCDRDQPLLLPPDLRDWLPEDHLAWFVIEAVEELDLERFYCAYCADGHGRAAHEPKMMVGLFAYAYCVGERSSRGIERRCREDVAFRVICANQVPDHATIARFRVRHQEPLADLFGQVLGLCAEAGLVRAGVLAVDGSKFAAAASDSAIHTYEEIAAEILAEAAEIDAAEDQRYGEARGDELPEQLTTQHGRKGWLREAKRRLDAERAARKEPVPRDRERRLEAAHRRLVENWRGERRANRAYEAYRSRGVMKDGRRFGTPPKPYEPPDKPGGKINTTDPDARRMKFGRNFIPAYNAQAVATEDQIIVAAEVATEGGDFEQLDPMVSAAERELEDAGVEERPGIVLADAGYWSNDHIDSLRERGMTPIVAPDTTRNRSRKTRLGGYYDFMRRVLATERGSALYSKRMPMVEPVFAQIKANRRIGRFKRRGRAAARSEWRLIAATHNLLKLHPPVRRRPEGIRSHAGLSPSGSDPLSEPGFQPAARNPARPTRCARLRLAPRVGRHRYRLEVKSPWTLTWGDRKAGSDHRRQGPAADRRRATRSGWPW
ncbi:MAG: transposase [Gaiellaceae bacterium]